MTSSPLRPPKSVEFELDGSAVAVEGDAASLLDALRDELGIRSVKDGCSPQGQCGCCTVLVDGSPRVACVTPVARVANRRVTTIDGIADVGRWTTAFAATGASQCGFCTPGIITRLSTLAAARLVDRAAVDKALLAHLCRCTGWQTIHEACVAVATDSIPTFERDGRASAGRRATLEGGASQSVGVDVAAGRGDFADDSAPVDAMVAAVAGDGNWIVAETAREARRQAGKVPGRRTTAPVSWPVEVPDGDWSATVQTTWVEPAYLEPDASWCAPGGTPVSPLGNGGAFGGKVRAEVGAVARRLADEHGRPVRVLFTREDVVRHGPKRPPLAIGLDATGGGRVCIARPATSDDEGRLAAMISTVAPSVRIEFVDVAGPPVSADLRAAGWGEVAGLLAAATADRRGDGWTTVRAPNGAVARARIDVAGRVAVAVWAGDPLDAVVLRSYCIGAAHMALGMVHSEAISLDAEGEPHDLTIRSFGILRAVDTPEIEITIADDSLDDDDMVHTGSHDADATAATAAITTSTTAATADVADTRSDSGPGEPVNGSDAVFAAVLGAAWRASGRPARLPAPS